MGTDKRQRQKEGRALRIAAAEAAQRKADQRALVLRVVLVLVVVGVLVAGLFVLAGDDEDETASTTTASFDTSLPDLTQPPSLPSAAGMPCVEPVDPPVEGQPVVPVQVGEPPTELVIEDLVEGTGEEVPNDPTTSVTVNYVGVSCSTGTTFDSSYERGTPATFALNGVIPGWTEGIPGMKVGGQRLLGIPSELAYGAAGRPEIAPDETLWFVVELVSIGDGSTDDTAADPATETTIP